MKIESRVIFLDNLRFFFVLCVVLQHAGTAYIGLNWWPVRDDMSLLASCMVSLFDAFLMPSLFFVAGYFAIPSVRKGGSLLFMRGKLKRLGIPWLVCILTIGPILPLVYHYTRDGLELTISYLDRWTAVMGAALQFDIGMMPPMNQLMQNDLFYQRYMWFIGLLILFFACFSGLYRIRRQWFEPSETQLRATNPSALSTLGLFLAVGFLTLIGSVVIIGLVMFLLAPGTKNPEAWFTLGNIVQFRVSRIFLHVTYFSIGVLAFRNRWLERGRFPGHLKTWVVLFLMLAPVLLLLAFMKESGMGLSEEIMGLLFWVVMNFLTVTSLGLCGALAKKYWNCTTPLNRQLSANSYNLYLAHYPFVIGLQLLLYNLPAIPPPLKFAIVSLVAAIAAYAVSHFLIKPHPKTTIIVMTTLFLGMAVFIRP